MFWRKKQVDTEKIHTLNDALKAIKTYIYLQEWEKAKSAIEDVRLKEKAAFEELEMKIKDDYRELQKQRRIFDKNMLYVGKLEKDYEVKKIQYDRKIDAQRFKIRFQKIREEIKKLSVSKNNSEALNLLGHFLEENQGRSEVVTYYAKEKKRILNNIKKNQEKDKRKIKDNEELEALRLAGLTLKDKKDKQAEAQKVKDEKMAQSF